MTQMPTTRELAGVIQEHTNEVKLKLEIDGKRYSLIFNKDEFEKAERTEENAGSLVKVFASAARVVTRESVIKELIWEDALPADFEKGNHD